MEKLELDLSEHSDVFNDKTIVFDGSIGFVYGENGTGKTTISNEICNQFSDNYNVCRFKDFTNLIGVNGRLNAISLGQINVELQEKINAVTESIANSKKQLTEPEEGEDNNAYSKLMDATKRYNAQQNKIGKLLQASASRIKNLTNPQVAPTNYNKNSLINDIPNALLLSAKEIEIAKETALAKKKNDIPKVGIIAINPLDILTATNELLKKKVTPSVIIKELEDNPTLRNFAQEGMELHKRGDRCAFCGSDISDERWEQLDNYFNDEVSKLKAQIQQKIDKINATISEIDSANTPKSIAFYPELKDEADSALLDYTDKLKEIRIFLSSTKEALSSKKDNLFKVSEPLVLSVPDNAIKAIATLNELISRNNTYSSNLAQRINNAKERLRLHAVKEALENAKYSDKKATLSQLEEQKKNAEESFNAIKKKLQQDEESLEALYKETEDESTIANMINKTLIANQHTSFTLSLAKDDAFGQSGQYKVLGRNGVERDITELSTGEKNTVAILYFIYSLEAEIKKKPRAPLFVIIDDPVNSNDSTMQYMIITEIKKLYSRDIFKQEDRIVILSHNTHFFINIRPYGNARYSKRFNSFNLITGLDGKTHISKITSIEKDLKTNYDTLWINLVSSFLDNNADNMLNNARRICASFTDFNRIDIEDFYGNAETKKLLDVNSHEISGEEMRMTGINAARLKPLMEQTFRESGFEKHFKDHWSFAEAIVGSGNVNDLRI